VRCSPVLPLRNSCFAQQLPSSPAIFFPVRTRGNDERLCPGPLFSGRESGPGGLRRGLVTEFFSGPGFLGPQIPKNVGSVWFFCWRIFEFFQAEKYDFDM
jgi:hypothetical protein